VMGDQVRIGSKASDFSFRREDGHFATFQNKAVGDALSDPKTLRAPRKPRWTKAIAIQRATAFYPLFVVPSNVHIGAAEAEYISEPNQAGYWRVRWPRVDEDGYPFYGDFVSIQIPEGSCPLGAAVFLSTPYLKAMGSRLSQDEATSKAQAAVADMKFLGSTEFYSDDDRIVANKPTTAELVVVLPTKDLKAVGGPSTGTARLAWILWFQPEHLRKQTGDGYNDSFALWVDAYNGQIIGRDGYL
jgi:hypothetical protein